MAEQQIQVFVNQDGTAQLDVTVDQDTAWLSLDQVAALFDRDKSVVSRHIRNVFNEGDLERGSVVAKNATTASDGKTYQVDYFNLDATSSRSVRRTSCPVAGTSKPSAH